MLVTGGREGHITLWRLPAGEVHQVLETRAGAVRALALSPDGKFLASGHEDLAIRLWTFDAQTHLHLQRTLLGHTQTIWSVAFGPSPSAQPATRPAMQGAATRTPTRQLLVTGSSDQGKPWPAVAPIAPSVCGRSPAVRCAPACAVIGRPSTKSPLHRTARRSSALVLMARSNSGIHGAATVSIR
jgi:hypothetical protein